MSPRFYKLFTFVLFQNGLFCPLESKGIHISTDLHRACTLKTEHSISSHQVPWNNIFNLTSG